MSGAVGKGWVICISLAFQLYLAYTQSQFINSTNTEILEDVFPIWCILMDGALDSPCLLLCLQGHQGSWYSVSAGQEPGIQQGLLSCADIQPGAPEIPESFQV